MLWKYLIYVKIPFILKNLAQEVKLTIILKWLKESSLLMKITHCNCNAIWQLLALNNGSVLETSVKTQGLAESQSLCLFC